LFNDGSSGAQAYATQIMAAASTPLTGVEMVTQGLRHACVLNDGGEVWCWGAGIGGGLGQGDDAGRVYPSKVTLPAAATTVGAGSDATCALVGTGVYCWGSNGSGQVGIGTPSQHTDGCINFCKLTPAQVVDGTDTPITGVKDLSMDYLAACATMADDSLWCWGSGAGDVATPLSVVGNPVVNVAQHSACSAGPINGALRYLTRDNVLKNPANTVTQVCP
jgi:alpha-tubulin suppressor-like RCC1 family protein